MWHSGWKERLRRTGKPYVAKDGNEGEANSNSASIKWGWQKTTYQFNGQRKTTKKGDITIGVPQTEKVGRVTNTYITDEDEKALAYLYFWLFDLPKWKEYKTMKEKYRFTDEQWNEVMDRLNALTIGWRTCCHQWGDIQCGRVFKPETYGHDVYVCEDHRPVR